MAKTLYIHIGTPKTGTTALQLFLDANRNVLEKKGIYYPDSKKYDITMATQKYVSAGNYAWLVLGNRENNVKIIKEFLQNHDTILLSSERIWGEIIDKSAWLKEIKSISENVNIIIIVYLRRQVDYLESLYNETVRVVQNKNKIQDVFNDKIHFFDEIKRNTYYDKELNSMAEVIGKENIKIRIYEKRQLADGNIIHDFLKLLGLEFNDEFESPKVFFNQSCNIATIELKRRLNNLIAADCPKTLNTVFFESIIEEGVDPGNDIQHFSGLVDGVTRFEFMKKYDESNSRVAREYLNRPDGVLFYDKIDVSYIPPEIKNEEIYDAAIKIYASAIMKMNNRFNSKIDALSQKSDCLLLEIDEIKRTNAKLRKYINNMKSSKSWRLTKPLRWLSSKFKKIKKKYSG